MLVKYSGSWAPGDWQPKDPVGWLKAREKGKHAYPIAIARGLAWILEVPEAWLLGEIDPYPPPVVRMSEVERLYLPGNLRRYGELWIQGHWRGDRGFKI